MTDKPPEKESVRFAKVTRLGAGMLVVAAISIAAIEASKYLEFLHSHLVYGALTLGGAGIVLLLCDMKRWRTQPTPDEVLQFLKNPHFYGLVLVVSALIYYAFAPPYNPPALPVTAAAPKPAPEPPPPVVFPDLHVSGVVLNGQRSAATINGQVVLVGEDVQGVKLVRVTESSIIVELQGLQKEIAVGQPISRDPSTAK